MKLFIALALAAAALGACAAPAATPAPTPEIVTRTVSVEVPGPTITVTPSVCIAAIDGLNEALDAENDILLTIYELGLEAVSEAQIDTFLALDLDGMNEDIADCIASAEVGS